MAEPQRSVVAVPATSRDAHPVSTPPHLDRDDDFEIGGYLRTFARYWMLLVGAAVLGAVGGYALTRLQPVLYEGVTTLIVLAPTKGDTRPTSTASFRALLVNFSLSSKVIHEMGLDKPPDGLSPQRFHERALTVEELPGTNLVRVNVRLADPGRAAEASRRLAREAVELNRRISAGESTAVRDQLKAHLDESASRMKDAEAQLLAYQKEAQVDLLKRDADAMLDERGELLKLLISIESEKGRLTAAEQEIKRQDRVLSVGRVPRAEEALRRAALSPERPPEGTANAETLDLSNPYLNPVYQTLDFQIATSRARLAALEQQRRQLVDVKKLGGPELAKLSELYSGQVELARRQNTYDLAKRVYTDLAVRYEEARTEALTSSAQLQVVDEAIAPERPVSRKGARSAALGLVAGLLLAALGALALERRAGATHAARTT